MHEDLPEELPPMVREVLAVFEDELSGVRFGDVDAVRLREVAARVRAAEAEVEEARVRLDAARRLHEDELAGLSALAQRALAYARIYAEGEPALAERLAPLGAPEAAGPTRRRRRRADVEAAELPFEPPALKVAAG